MSKLPVLKPREAIKVLSKLGFLEKRQKGSHKLFENDRGTIFLLAVHQGKELKRGVVHDLMNISGLELKDFLKLLNA